MTLTEFKETCKIVNAKEFIFDTDNSYSFGRVDYSVKLTFDSLVISEASNDIVFIGSTGLMRFKDVCSVTREQDSVLGAVFNIECNGINPYGNIFTIIAR